MKDQEEVCKKKVRRSEAKGKQLATDKALEKESVVRFGSIDLDTEVISYGRDFEWESSSLSSLRNILLNDFHNDW